MRWKTGTTVEVLAVWQTATVDNGVQDVTTGSPFYRVSILDQATGDRLYDQGDGTFDTPQVDLPFAGYDAAAGGFRDEYDMVADECEVTIECFHPDHPVVIRDVGWVGRVTPADLTQEGDIEQDTFQPVPS